MLAIQRRQRRYLKIGSRSGKLHIRLCLRDARARDDHGRRIGERLIDQRVELGIAIARPPTRGGPAVACEVDVVREIDLLRRDLGVGRAVVMDQRAPRQHGRYPRDA
jgi:hypothetical protein